MKFGMLHLFESPGGRSEQQMVEEQVSLMEQAEDLGFDSLWPAEHHFSEYGVCGSPAVNLAAVARTTKRIRLGTGVVSVLAGRERRVSRKSRAAWLGVGIGVSVSCIRCRGLGAHGQGGRPAKAKRPSTHRG